MKTQKIVLLLFLTIATASCGVQQFAFNTNVGEFENGGEVFGEKTRGKKVKKGGDWFVFGINVSSCDTKQMAESMSATSYTVETKSNILSFALWLFTGSVIDYKVVKVIKRDN